MADNNNKPSILDFGEPKENSIIKVIGVGGGGGSGGAAAGAVLGCAPNMVPQDVQNFRLLDSALQAGQVVEIS